MSDLSIKVTGVSVRYRLSKEKPRTLQEYLIHRLKGRKTYYEDFWALKNVSLEVRSGETLGIIGANSAGKSTLLKVVAGVLKPIAGSVFVNGKIAPLIELGAGFDMELNGSENIYLNASILGLSRKEIDSKYQAILEFSELQEFIYSPLKSYSSGMIARLGFSIATEVDPSILIIDEILAVGDEHFKKKSTERIFRFREKGVTMLFVSHNMKEVRDLCSTVLWMEHGSPKMLGKPEEVTEAYLNALK